MHVIGVLRRHGCKSGLKLSMHAYNYNFQYEIVNGKWQRYAFEYSYIYIHNMAVEEGSGCTCTTDDVVQFYLVGDPRSCEFELPTAGDVEWLLFSYT